MKWLGNAALSNAIFIAAQLSETMSNANWTEHLNTLRLISQDSFPPHVNYAQREYSANHKPGNACENISGPLSNCSCWKPRHLTFAVRTLGDGEEWGLGMWTRQGSKEHRRESGLMQGDLELCSSNLAARGGCFPISFSGCNSVMHSSWEEGPLLCMLLVSPRSAPIRFLGKSGRG